MTFNVILKPGSITWKQFYLICWLYRSAGSTPICYQDLFKISMNSLKILFVHNSVFWGLYSFINQFIWGKAMTFFRFQDTDFFFKWLRHAFKILTPNLSPPLERTRRAPLATILWSTKPRASWSSAFACHWTPSGEA